MKFDRKVVAFKSAEHASEEIGDFADFNLVSVLVVDRRIVFVFEKERGAGRPPSKKKAESEN